jgi:hypothetical protein
MTLMACLGSRAREERVRPNKRLELTKRDRLVGGLALARRRRAVFIESRFAAQARCSADIGASAPCSSTIIDDLVA